MRGRFLMRFKIVSGGQTGVDRGGLEAAKGGQAPWRRDEAT